ncbi:hypothetical protein [Bacillus thuringiensis]|uniref:hypothetical protein n=1 Tax=Bacillus thuringiensis TaxID=1428 RepID=UPI0021D67F33|nr:hypothetical protein [Bacillus thuringiensis]MCU7668028.1 hypothetical protein [Bacillus thuringiensis]
MSDERRSKNNKGEDKTLKALIALAGFAIGATSMVAWNNRKTIQDKALDARDRALELKEKTFELTETVKNKIIELQENTLKSSTKTEKPEQADTTGNEVESNETIEKKEVEAPQSPNNNDDNNM